MHYFIRDDGREYPPGMIVRAVGEPGRITLIPDEQGDEQVLSCQHESTMIPGRWLTVVTRPRSSPDPGTR